MTNKKARKIKWISGKDPPGNGWASERFFVTKIKPEEKQYVKARHIQIH